MRLKNEVCQNLTLFKKLVKYIFKFFFCLSSACKKAKILTHNLFRVWIWTNFFIISSICKLLFFFSFIIHKKIQNARGLSIDNFLCTHLRLYNQNGSSKKLNQIPQLRPKNFNPPQFFPSSNAPPLKFNICSKLLTNESKEFWF